MEHYFQSDDIISNIKLGGGHCINSKNYIITLRSGKKYYLKIMYNYQKDTIQKINIMNECFLDGIKVPEIFPNSMQQLYTIKENTLFLLLKHYCGDTCRYTPKEIFSAGENLARLNERLRSVSYSFSRSPLYNDLSDIEIQNIQDKIGIENHFLKKITNLCTVLPELYEEMIKIKTIKRKEQVVHLDYNIQNVLFYNNKVEVILDFDSLVTASELLSAAFACDRFSKDPEGMKIFLQGYQKQNNRFSSGEIQSIPFYVKREALSRINYILRTYFFQNNPTWSFELDKHLNILRKMDGLKEKFLEIENN